MPESESNRVYIEDAKEAPEDAIIREGARGRLFYRPDERGRNNYVGGNKDNDLLENGESKQDPIEEGAVFYDTMNEQEVMLVEVDGDTATISAGTTEWVESVNDVRRNVESGDWVLLPDEDREIERQDDDPCWEGYEMVGTKVQDGEKVPNCVPKSKIDRAKELAEKDRTFGKPFEGPNNQGPFESFDDCTTQMEGEVKDPEGWCAWAHHEDTGEWPGEKSDMKQDQSEWGNIEITPEQEFASFLSDALDVSASDVQSTLESLEPSEGASEVDNEDLVEFTAELLDVSQDRVREELQSLAQKSVVKANRPEYDTARNLDEPWSGLDLEDIPRDTKYFDEDGSPNQDALSELFLDASGGSFSEYSYPVVEVQDDGTAVLRAQALEDAYQAAQVSNDERIAEMANQLAQEEFDQNLTQEVNLSAKVYVADPSDVPDREIIERDDRGLFFRQQAYDLAEATYPEDIVEQIEWEMPDAEEDEEAEDPPSEEQYQERLEDLADEMDDAYGKQKRRVYVDDPSEAPEDANVQEGQQGGMYYETDPGGGPSYDAEAALDFLGEETEFDDHAAVQGDARDAKEVAEGVAVDYASAINDDVSEEDFDDFVNDVEEELGEKYFTALSRYGDDISTQAAYSVSREMVDTVMDEFGRDGLADVFESYSGIDVSN